MAVTELLTAMQLAARLHVSPRTIGDWARNGLIPSVRPTYKVVRFEWDAVLAAIRSAPGLPAGTRR